MAGKFNHRFVTQVVDEGVAGEVGPSEWNDSFVLSGGNEGAVPVRRAAEADGFALEYIGAPPAFVDPAQKANVSTNETDLHTFTIAAGHFSVNKKAVRFKASGSFAANANVKTLKFYIGATAITLNPVTGSPNGLKWDVEVTIIRTGVDGQKLLTRVLVGTAVELISSSTAAIDDAGAIVVKLTGTSGTASNDILSEAASLEYLG